VTGIGIAVTVVQGDTTATREGMAWAGGYRVLWSAGIGCIAVALAQYDANISQVVPLDNLNPLLAVARLLASRRALGQGVIWSHFRHSTAADPGGSSWDC
jgi:hypothetical protein